MKNISGEMVTVIAILGLGVLAMSILTPILPLYLTSIGVTPVILGLMFSVAMVGMVIGESCWGWVSDRIGMKLPLNMGTFVCALAVLFFAFTRNVAAIFAIFFFWGVVRSALFGPSRGYIGASAPPLRKATFMAIIAAMLSASRSLGALPSGFMADNWGYHSVFFTSCGIAVVAGLLVITGLRKARSVSPSPTDITPCSNAEPLNPNQGLSFRSFTPQCLVTTLQFTGPGTLMTFLPLLATQVVGITATEVGILFTIMGISTMVLGIPMGMLADRVGKKTFMILGLLVSGTAMAGIACAQNYAWLIAFTVTSSLGLVMFSPAALGLLSESVPLERQSTAMGIYGGVCENTGIIAGSALGGFVWSAWGPQPTFLMGTIAAGLGAILCFSLVKVKTIR